MSIRAVFNLVSFNLYSFPYIISKPRSIASKKSDAVYGPDGKIISTTAQEDAAKGSSITVIDIKEITSALPSNDDLFIYEDDLAAHKAAEKTCRKWEVWAQDVCIYSSVYFASMTKN